MLTLEPKPQNPIYLTKFNIQSLYDKFYKKQVTIDIVWDLNNEMLEDIGLTSLEKLKYAKAKEKQNITQGAKGSDFDDVLIGDEATGINEDGIPTLVGPSQTLTLVGTGVTAEATISLFDHSIWSLLIYRRYIVCHISIKNEKYAIKIK